MPPQLYAVEGKELNIYFANLSILPVPGTIEVIAKVGTQYAECYRFTPGAKEIGTHDLRIEWRDADGTLLADASTVIEVAPAKAEPKRLTLLMIGDSLTNAAIYPRHVVEALRADGFSIFTIGSHAGYGKPAGADGVVHEGYGGWQFETFLTRWQDKDEFRSKSPFLTGPGQFDLAAYFAKHGDRKPDIITIMLGVNDIAGCTQEKLPAALAKIEKNADTLINALAAAVPHAKIGIAIIPPPAASQDAFGLCYHTSIKRAQYMRNLFAFWQMLERKYRHHARYELIPVNVNIDCKNNYPEIMLPYNTHNPQKHSMQSNAVHPSSAGYQQIGDSFYFWIRNTVK